MSQPAEQAVPHNIEAEEAVLGSILLNPDALYEVLPFLRHDDFYLVRHGWIWQAIIRLHERRDPVDHLTVVTEIEGTGKLAEIGGAAYIISLINKAPSALNVEGYGHIVERMALRRRLLEAAQQVARVAHADDMEIDEVVGRAQHIIFGVTERKMGGRRVRFGDVPDAPDGEVQSLPTGIGEIEHITDHRIAFGRSLAILGASGHYKTTLAGQIVSNLAILGHPVLYVSQEMTGPDIRDRMVAYQALLTGKSVQETRRNLKGIPLEFLAGQQWLDDIEATTRLMMLEYERPIVVVIDTVQKLFDCIRGGSQEQGTLAAVSARVDGFKLRTGALVIPILQQFLDTNDANPERLRPGRNNVKGTKAFYEDCDCMIGTYWADGWRAEFPDGFDDILCPPGTVMVKCIKNRFGKVGLSKLLKLLPNVPALIPRPYGEPEPTTHAAMSEPGRADQMILEGVN